MFGSHSLIEKWGPVLDAEGTPPIKDAHKKAITAVVLENTEKALAEERQQSNFNLTETANVQGGMPDTGGVAKWDPILISLVRRAMPNIIAYDIAGVQPMTGPTGLIFYMKSKMEDAAARTAAQTGADVLSVQAEAEALHDVPNTSFSGKYSTPKAELMGQSGENPFREMSFTIEKTSVTAQSRALKAEYTMELAQDLKAVHGLDAEGELANILSVEILAEINREVIDLMNFSAEEVYPANIGGGVQHRTIGFAIGIGGHGDGRWEVEHYKNLLMKIMFEANAIGISTRRGRGNFIVCSSNVASALSATGALEYAPVLQSNALNVDDNGNLFAGTIHGNMKVFIDPFAAADYVTVGYKGTNAYDAGFFYCPYVPLTMLRAIGQDDFQPRIGFKTRYGMVSNPFTAVTEEGNVYFRTFNVTDLV